jgi:hypothetical protein
MTALPISCHYGCVNQLQAVRRKRTAVIRDRYLEAMCLLLSASNDNGRPLWSSASHQAALGGRAR